MKIFKYPLEVMGFQTVEMPANHKILHVGDQHGQLMMWTAVGDSELIDVEIVIVGTGHFYNPEGKTFISTVVMGQLVWHIFKEE